MQWPVNIVILRCVSKNVPSSTGYKFNTHPPIFITFGTFRHAKIGYMYNFLNLACT